MSAGDRIIRRLLVSGDAGLLLRDRMTFSVRKSGGRELFPTEHFLTEEKAMVKKQSGGRSSGIFRRYFGPGNDNEWFLRQEDSQGGN